jgi:eukaryotic-like serine/threonine-protein kinase
MPAKVTLKIANVDPQAQEYVFDERATCIIGRSSECSVKIPDDESHKMISRHHCLLDINPLDIRVRDFGSLNGTYVGAERIGKREHDNERGITTFPEFDLKDGDLFSLGKPGHEQSVGFRVGIFVPACCFGCSEEIPEDQKTRAEKPGVFLCESCRKKDAAATPETLVVQAKLCSRCGRDVSSEIGENRQGKFICAARKAHPLGIVTRLLERARSVRREEEDGALITIRGYRILKELGAGGMGAVYLAQHEENGKRVALKIMLPRIACQKKVRDAFLREGENTKALDHPNVVRFWDSGCAEGTFFFTLEFCDRGSVDRRIKECGGRLAVEEATAIALQALDGLEYAHHAEIPYVKLPGGSTRRGYGVIHRDLKPHNLFLAGSGNGRIVKIGDFGLAKAFDLAGLSGQTATGAVAGTPYFMPRQQVINFKYAKPEVDVWALAATLYFMLTGSPPRRFASDQDLWFTVLETSPVPIRERNRSIPDKLAAVIDRALIDKPEIPFKTAAELKRALEGVL